MNEKLYCWVKMDLTPQTFRELLDFPLGVVVFGRENTVIALNCTLMVTKTTKPKISILL